jgi:hypothetical protein
VMMCDECNAIWHRPDAISLESAIFPESPDYVVDQLQCSVGSSAGARWATIDQIKDNHLEAFVAGDGTPLNE